MHLWDSNPDKLKDCKSFDLDDDYDNMSNDLDVDLSDIQHGGENSKFCLDDFTITTTVSNTSCNNDQSEVSATTATAVAAGTSTKHDDN